MVRCILFPLIPSLLAVAAHAGEFTLQAKPFFTEQTFAAIAMPSETTLIRLDAKTWTDFEITQLAAHGSKVAAGGVVKLAAGPGQAHVSLRPHAAHPRLRAL